MDKDKVLEFIKSEDIEDIEEIKYKPQVLVLRFYYDFDADELNAAEAFANDECDGESRGEVWYGEFFLPYLDDLAADSIGEIMENCMDELGIRTQFVVYNVSADEYEYSEAIGIFFDKDQEFDIDNVLDELKL
ncbi:hypothetical protein ACJDT4_18125 [Clostridium neuense]|uniref:DUF2004 domain-containing protein n=1 Tax=Clostridium neuense TaxID=1728934 RepID=A0ABW8TIJ5_9CLOT